MKKYILILLFSAFSFSQEGLVCSNEDYSFSIYRNNDQLIVNSKELGLCQEDNILIFNFENNTTFSITSYNQYNCKGLSLFTPFKKQLGLFKNKLISIELINGITKKSILYILKEEEQGYFFEPKE